ncbi:MAG: ATP-binding cassette domain-containing protein [Pseudomonadota bacterium]|nr:ATP-binding cassette domain-containing protein [Pseudomonadota bacterium]
MQREDRPNTFAAQGLREILARQPQVASDPVFYGMLSQLCMRLLPSVMVKDVLGSLPIHAYANTGERLLATLRTLGFVARELSLPAARIRLWHLPALFLDEDGERALLVLAQDEATCVLDHEGRTVARDALGRGTFHCLSREAHVNPLSEESRKHRRQSWLHALISTFSPLGWVIALCTLFVTLLSLAQPFVIAAFYRAIFAQGDTATVPWLAPALVLVVLAIQCAMALRAHALAWLAARLNYLVGRATFEKIMQLPIAQSRELDAKGQSARIRSFENVSDFLASPLALALLDLPAALAAGALIAWMIAPVGLAIGLFGLCYLALFFVAERKMKVLTSMNSDLATRLQHTMVETFAKRELIRECGLQHRWADLHKTAIARAQSVTFAIARLMAMVEAVSSFLFAATFITVVGLLALDAGEHMLGAPQMLGVVFLTALVAAPLHGLCMAIPRFEQARRALEQINTLMQTESEIELDAQRRRLPALRGEVSLASVTMRQGDGRPLLLALDIETRAGEIIAITGAAGTGKSVLLALVQGLASPSFGTIRIEGVDIEQLPRRTLRSAIGYVPQAPALLPGCLRENLAMANPLASEEQLRKVLHSVGLDYLDLDARDHDCDPLLSFIWQFSLAQALLASTGILLIDEVPNSVINGPFGKVLRKVLRSAKGRLTVFFVSNRSDYLDLADRVIALRHARTPLIMTPGELAEVA